MRRRHRAVALLLATVMGTTAVTAVGSEASAAETPWLQIHNRGNGKCLDYAMESVGQPFPRIQLWTCVEDPIFPVIAPGWEQQWYVGSGSTNPTSYFIQNRLTGDYLTTLNRQSPDMVTAAPGGGAGPGVYWDIIYQSIGSTGFYHVLRNHNSGLCLELSSNSSGDGTLILQNYCDYSFSNPAQQWMLGANLPFIGGVIVPNVRWYDPGTAIEMINGQGLTASLGYLNDCIDPGNVDNQYPSGGSIVSPGTTVSLTVSTCSGGGGGGDDGGGGLPK